MKSDPVIATSHSEFVELAAKQLYQCALSCIEKNDRFTLVLSGGNSPKDIFIEIVKRYSDKIEWTKVHLFWLDERCVSPDHPDSNYGLAYKFLISEMGEIGSINRISGEMEPAEAARKYEREIYLFFGTNELAFDFILLGMGEDGHVASIFPDSKELELKDHVVLSTNQRCNGHFRVTLGIDVINRSHFKLLLINSQKKLSVYKSSNKALPISHIINPNVLQNISIE